jgi:glutamate synthase domain-containing protein 1
MARNSVGLHSDGHPFEIFVEGVRNGTVSAHDGDHALERWIEKEGYDSLEEAAAEHAVAVEDIVAVDGRR